MLTEFARDHAFTIGWFGLMAFVWFGWAQEDPPARWRWRLGIGSGAGAVLAGTFGYAVAARWGEGSAMDGRYQWFGALVLAEVLLAGLGALMLWRRGLGRWTAWWVALVVGLHLLPLTALLGDWSLALLGTVQIAGLLVLAPRLRGTSRSTSCLTGVFMGTTLLLFAVASLVVYCARW